MITADYGEQGPEHFDRLGVRHNVKVETDHRVRVYQDADPRGIVKRLGLTLYGWAKRWPGMEVFCLDIWDQDISRRSVRVRRERQDRDTPWHKAPRD